MSSVLGMLAVLVGGFLIAIAVTFVGLVLLGGLGRTTGNGDQGGKSEGR